MSVCSMQYPARVMRSRPGRGELSMRPNMIVSADDLLALPQGKNLTSNQSLADCE